MVLSVYYKLEDNTWVDVEPCLWRRIDDKYDHMVMAVYLEKYFCADIPLGQREIMSELRGLSECNIVPYCEAISMIPRIVNLICLGFQKIPLQASSRFNIAR